MIKYTDYSKSRFDLLEGYRILRGEEVLEFFDQDAERIILNLVKIENLDNGEISLTYDTPQLSLMYTQDVDYYEETLIAPQEDEKAINVCFLNKIDAKEFIEKIKRDGPVFPKFVPPTIIVRKDEKTS
jgi:hypothetical protein